MVFVSQNQAISLNLDQEGRQETLEKIYPRCKPKVQRFLRTHLWRHYLQKNAKGASPRNIRNRLVCKMSTGQGASFDSEYGYTSLEDFELNKKQKERAALRNLCSSLALESREFQAALDKEYSINLCNEYFDERILSDYIQGEIRQIDISESEIDEAQRDISLFDMLHTLAGENRLLLGLRSLTLNVGDKNDFDTLGILNRFTSLTCLHIRIFDYLNTQYPSADLALNALKLPLLQKFSISSYGPFVESISDELIDAFSKLRELKMMFLGEKVEDVIAFLERIRSAIARNTAESNNTEVRLNIEIGFHDILEESREALLLKKYCEGIVKLSFASYC